MHREHIVVQNTHTIQLASVCTIIQKVHKSTTTTTGRLAGTVRAALLGAAVVT